MEYEDHQENIHHEHRASYQEGSYFADDGTLGKHGGTHQELQGGGQE